MTVKILLELAWRYWHWFVIAVLSLLLVFMIFMLRESTANNKLMQVAHDLETANNMAEYQLQARQIENQNFKGVIDAVNQSTIRQKNMANKYDSVVTLNDSLSDSITNIETSLITANRSAVIDYTKSVNGLFAECSSRYLEMAKSAAREQEEARRLREAWPKR